MGDILADPVFAQEAAGLVHPVEGLINDEFELGREFQRHVLVYGAPQLTLVAVKRLDHRLDLLSAKGQNMDKRVAQVGRCPDLAHRDRHAGQVRVMQIAARQDGRQGTPDQFADAQLALAGRAAGGNVGLGHLTILEMPLV